MSGGPAESLADLLGVRMAELHEDGECLPPAGASGLPLAGGQLDVTEVAQRVPLSPPVADVPVGLQRPVVVRDRLAMAVQPAVDRAEDVECDAFDPAVAAGAQDGQRPLQTVDGVVEPAEPLIGVAQVAQGDPLPQALPMTRSMASPRRMYSTALSSWPA